MESKHNERFKLCPNCDGRVLIEATICPYCASALEKKILSKEEPISLKDDIRSLSPSETLASLYPPPYRPKVQSSENFEPIEPQAEVKAIDPLEEENEGEVVDNTFLHTMLFSVGINLVLIGLFLFLFAHNKQVILAFNARFWIFYLLIGGPLIYFGYRGFVRK